MSISPALGALSKKVLFFSLIISLVQVFKMAAGHASNPVPGAGLFGSSQERIDSQSRKNN